MTSPPIDRPTTPVVPLPWLHDLAQHGDRPALVTGEATVTYRALAARVDAFAGRLAGDRRLVLVEARNRVETVVAYLGALTAGHVVALVDERSVALTAALRRVYDPDVVVGADGTPEVLRVRSRHELHPELALLLSTSGSTGSGKLVRLSWSNLAANADQIAQYLAIRDSDRAATTLPLGYCYGLSVLHSHLSRGASLLLTELSVVDECFWTLFREAGASTFAGVPHTFELLERVGFERMDLPRLRYVTQAGGRMDAGRVRHWAGVGRRRGWDLFVMYGQTEATARMAYLPPDLALEHPESVGVPVPGGDLAVEDGELVYRGPNVMLGYATSAADLASGRTVQSLRTGDLGRRTDDGLYEVLGRRARFVKVLGHRIDLDMVEGTVRAEGIDVRCSGEDGLVVATVRPGARTPARGLARQARDRVAAASSCPRHAVRAVVVDEHPMLPTGKPDYRAITRLAPQPAEAADAPGAAGSVAQLYAALLGRADVGPGSTFVSLGGDSLSYVEVSIRLEERLGRLPPSWHLATVEELEREVPPPAHEERAGWQAGWRARHTVETGIWLRALAIVLIVGTHAGVFSLQGTAHALLVLAGYHLVRFQLAHPGARARVTRALRGVARVAAPALLVISAAHFLGGYYETRNLFLLNWALGQAQLGPPWRFWFIEALVLALAVTAGLCAVPPFNRAERRFPFAVPLALTTVSFTLRLDLFELPTPRMQGSALVVLFLFFLGWTAARASTHRHRVVVTVVAVATVGTFSGNPARDLLSLSVVLLVVWKPVSRVPALLLPAVRVLAASSLYIYVIHWQVLEGLWGAPLPATAGSLLAGIAYWWVWTRLGRALSARSWAVCRRVAMRRP
ncbi:MAG TPA: AMP-binding protein [Intrasporangium sp.]|uniref:AMP-binding protein n=1 Tax=Intrasporangium sp. TaxID=1925024 RepID=UPI002D79A7DB|nr:AMP-binding protein [Intrasporangium sp.]HET7399648.1 AMP-binding protein [Intrasporangium sp.]